MSASRVPGFVAQLPVSALGACTRVGSHGPSCRVMATGTHLSNKLPSGLRAQQPTCHHTGSRRHITTTSYRGSSRFWPSWTTTPPQPPSIHPHPTPSSSSSSNSTDPASELQPIPLPEQLRSLMRLVPHSVVVCTTTDPGNKASLSADSETLSPPSTPSESTPTPRAMTMSSFTSLTLRPTPLISFNVATPSRTLSAVERSRRFNIHVLRGGPEGAKVADWFTRGNASGDEGDNVFSGMAHRKDHGSGCSLDLATAQKAHDAPILQGDGVMYVLRCRVLDDEGVPAGGLVRVRDHVIVVGEVVEILESRTAEGEEGGREDEFGLVYADRIYRRLGETITKEKE